MYPGGWGLFAEEYPGRHGSSLRQSRVLQPVDRRGLGIRVKDTIYAPAMLSLRDLDRALAELDRVLNAGAKFIVLSAGPAYGR